MAINAGLPPELLKGTKEFFANRSLSELAKAQGVKPLHDPSVLLGGWPEDDNIDEFLEHLDKERNAQLLMQINISQP